MVVDRMLWSSGTADWSVSWGRLVCIHTKVPTGHVCHPPIRHKHTNSLAHTQKPAGFEAYVLLHNGGNSSRQIGHWSLYFIHPSKHALWKICLQGVTI